MIKRKEEESRIVRKTELKGRRRGEGGKDERCKEKGRGERVSIMEKGRGTRGREKKREREREKHKEGEGERDGE